MTLTGVTDSGHALASSEAMRSVVITWPGLTARNCLHILEKLLFKDLKTPTASGCSKCVVWAGKQRRCMPFSLANFITSREMWEVWPSSTNKTGRVGGILATKKSKPFEIKDLIDPTIITACKKGLCTTDMPVSSTLNICMGFASKFRRAHIAPSLVSNYFFVSSCKRKWLSRAKGQIRVSWFKPWTPCWAILKRIGFTLANGGRILAY